MGYVKLKWNCIPAAAAHRNTRTRFATFTISMIFMLRERFQVRTTTQPGPVGRDYDIGTELILNLMMRDNKNSFIIFTWNEANNKKGAWNVVRKKKWMFSQISILIPEFLLLLQPYILCFIFFSRKENELSSCSCEVAKGGRYTYTEEHNITYNPRDMNYRRAYTQCISCHMKGFLETFSTSSLNTRNSSLCFSTVWGMKLYYSCGTYPLVSLHDDRKRHYGYWSRKTKAVHNCSTMSTTRSILM